MQKLNFIQAPSAGTTRRGTNGQKDSTLDYFWVDKNFITAESQINLSITNGENISDHNILNLSLSKIPGVFKIQRSERKTVNKKILLKRLTPLIQLMCHPQDPKTLEDAFQAIIDYDIPYKKCNNNSWQKQILKFLGLKQLHPEKKFSEFLNSEYNDFLQLSCNQLKST